LAAGCNSSKGGFVDVTPTFDAAQFAGAAIDNPFLPWKVGAKFGLESTANETIEITVSKDKKTVAGVSCVVVHDAVTVNGKITEDTYDWYARAPASET
jgi:hypothetical protein